MENQSNRGRKKKDTDAQSRHTEEQTAKFKQ